MRTCTFLLLLVILSVFAAGCSKEKKDEAAKLEKKLMGDTTQVMDSLAEVQRVADSLATVQAEADKLKVQQEQAEESISKMPKQPAGEGYTVQVAGCENRDYAEHLVDVYTERGYQPYVTSITVEGQGYYRVRIGIFESLSDAKALQAELKDKYSVDTWVDVTLNNY